VIPGSLRTGLAQCELAATAAYELAQADAEVTRISLGDFPLPIYDGDLQTKSGVPKHAINLKRMIGAHHGVLIRDPEYNSSVPPLVKNTIDWVTRCRMRRRRGARCFVNARLRSPRRRESRLGRNPGPGGAAADSSACHATVIPNQLALSFADQAYDDMTD